MTGRSLAYVLVVPCIILSLVAGPLVQPVPALAAVPPETPINESPSNGAAVDTLTPTLRASAFEDADGDSLADSEWQIAGETLHGSAGDLTACYIPPGLLTYSSTYTWSVTYTDNASETSERSAEWHFTTVAAPHAEFSAAPTSAQVNEEISFTNASSGGSGSLICDWDFGDGSSGSSENPTHAYDAAGSYTVTLTVTDSAGGQDAMTREDYISVSAPIPDEPPVVTTVAASAIDTTSATLNGNLADPGTAASVNVSFEWGLTTAYGNTTAARSMTAAGAFSAALTGLTPAATYHFRAKAEGGDGTDYGDDRTFTTASLPDRPPQVTTAAATGIAAASATLNLTLTSLGTAASVQVSFEWGPTAGYGYGTPAQSLEDTGSLSYALSGLTPATTYHFRAGAVGDGTDYGDDRTFTTASLPDEPPEVTTRAASAMGASSATLNLNLASLGSAASVRVSFEWGLTTSYGSTTAAETVSRTGSFDFALSGLESGTTYHFRAVAVGDGTVYGGDLTFTTASAEPEPPAVATLDAGGIGTASATLNVTLTGLGTAASVQVSFEWGPTTDYGHSTEAQAMTGTGTLSQPLSGLEPATTYHFRARAVGDGTVYGGDLTFTTGSTPPVSPKVKTDDADTITGGSARLRGELVSAGTAAGVTVSFVWGTSPGGPYPNETPGAARTDGGEFYFDLDGLDLGTAYYFQARAVGDGISYGVEKSFTTIGEAPHIDSLTAYDGRPGQALTVKITGSNLGNATRVDLGDGIEVSEFTVPSDREIRAEIIIRSGAESAAREVSIVTPSGTATYRVPGGFLAGVPGEVTGDDGPRVHLWVYMAVAGGVAGVGLMVAFQLWLRRRLAGRSHG